MHAREHGKVLIERRMRDEDPAFREVTTLEDVQTAATLDLHVHAPRGHERLLSAPVRRQVLDVVARHPGLPVGELQAMVGVGWGTLHHHLKKLEEAGLVRTVSVGRRRIVHLAGAGAHEGFALLRGRTARTVARAIVQNPGIGIADLARLSGGSPRAVYYHVKRLAEAGLVTSGGNTRYAHLSAAEPLPRILREASGPGE